MSKIFNFIFILFITNGTSVLYAQFKASQDCAQCHDQIYGEWKTSQHAASSRASNPFFQRMYSWANSSGNNELAENCLSCHEPARDLLSSEQSDLINEGISCEICHATEMANGAGDWKKLAPQGVKYGGLKDALSTVHKSVYAPKISEGQFCLACHSNSKNVHGISFCSTENEWKKSSFSKKGIQCQDCHMPGTEGIAAQLGKMRDRIHSHAFYGGYSAEMLNNCAQIELSANEKNGATELLIKVSNHSVGHALPTGSPLRMVILKLELKNAQEKILWQNYVQNPIKEDPQAVFMKLLQDEDGNAPVPPWEATSEKFDQRLLPDKPREFHYVVPDISAITAEATLIYRLAPPPVLAKMGIKDDVYTTPKIITRRTVQVNKTAQEDNN
jgi:hypothetical protein